MLSANDVAPFFEDIPKAADIVRKQEIDGHALIFLKEEDFEDQFDKLGPKTNAKARLALSKKKNTSDICVFK